MTPSVSVIIPSYNESGCIAELVARIARVSCGESAKDGGWEIIVVDDNSPDGTGVLCQSLVSTYASLRVVIRTAERGLATAVRRGIEEASGRIVVVMDADLSHPPEMLPVLVKEVEGDSVDVAVASRFVKGGGIVSSRHRVWGSKILNVYLRTLLGLSVKDVTGGFFAVKREALQDLNIDSVFRGYGDYCFALLYRGTKVGWHIREVGFTYHPRESGASKTGFLGAGFSYGVRALKLRFGAK